MITPPRRLLVLTSMLFAVLLIGCGVIPLPHEDVPEAGGGPPVWSGRARCSALPDRRVPG